MGGKTGTTSSTTKIPPEVMARYNAVNTRAEDVAAKPFQQYGTTPDAFVAQLNQQQRTGQAGMNQYANAAQPVLNQVQQGYTPEGFSQGVQGYMNPYLQSAVGATTAQMQNVAGQQQAQMKGSAIGQGAFGGDRANIGLGNLMNQQNLALGQTIGGMQSQGFQNAAQNYMTGLGQRGQTALAGQQAGLQGAQAQIGAGTLGQQTEQAGKTAQYNQFLQEQAYPYQVAQFLANIAMGTGALSGSSTTTTQPMPFFSDERLKDDIEKIGKTFDGQDIIKFRYKGEDGPKQIGLSAQNVEKHHPEAVGLAKGYKTVDYDAATKDAAKRGHFEDGGMASEGGAVGLQSMGQGFAAGGGAYDPYDPYSIQNIIARQQGFFDGGERSHVPTARGLSGGVGKHGRVPEASLPVGRLMVGSPPPAPLESGMSQAMNAANTGETISKMFSTNEKTGESGLARQILESIKSRLPKDEETKKPETEARGGLVGYASGGMPYDMDEDPKKLDIPDESSKFKMPEQKHLPGAMQDPTMKAIMDMAKLASGFMKNGGRAEYQEGGAPEDELGRYLGAIAKTESGGQKNPYAALGPLTKTGDRAYGKYQVMGANIPSWTEEALGQKMTPDEYLANTDAQEKVARHHFGKALNKYGTPEDAASVWFTGKPRSEAGNVADILGTTNSQYVQKFNEALGRPTEPREARADLPAEKAVTAGDFNVPGEKSNKGFMEDLLQEKYVVPALAGLGSMLSSRSPYLLPALGEGLAGGAAAYMGQQKTRADIGRTEAETELTDATMINSAVVETSAGPMMRIATPEGYQLIPLGVYKSNPNLYRLKLAPFAPGENKNAFAKSAGLGATTEKTMDAKTPTGLVPSAGPDRTDIVQEKPPTSDIVKTELTPPSGSGLAAAEAPPAEAPPAMTTGSMLSETDRSLIDKSVQETITGQTTASLASAPKKFEDAKAIQAANLQIQPILRTLAGEFASLPREASLLTPGVLNPYSRKIAESLNSIAATLGTDPFVNEADIKTVGSIDKNIERLADELRGKGQYAASDAVNSTRKMLPQMNQSTEAIGKNLADVLVDTQRQNDLADYYQAIRDEAAAKLGPGNVAMADRIPDLPGVNWADNFAKNTDEKYLNDRRAMEEMFNTVVTNPEVKDARGNPTPINDPESGRPMNYMSLIMRYGDTLSPEVRQQIEAEFGKGILKYFGIKGE